MKNDTCTKTQYIELTEQELDSIDGGNPFVTLLWGVAGGIIGNYAYESWGGAKGINNTLSSLGTNLNAAMSSAAQHWPPPGFGGPNLTFRLPS